MMEISIVAILCHALAAVPSPGGLADPGYVCHEELVMKTEMENSILACAMSQPALADWKMKSKFASDQWWIKKIKCVPGNYVLKDMI
jgi:hypothetical protein